MLWHLTHIRVSDMPLRMLTMVVKIDADNSNIYKVRSSHGEYAVNKVARLLTSFRNIILSLLLEYRVNLPHSRLFQTLISQKPLANCLLCQYVGLARDKRWSWFRNLKKRQSKIRYKKSERTARGI